MSEEHAEKRFDATPSRRERAKREGNAARSSEVASIAAFAAGAAGLAIGLPLLGQAAVRAVRAAAIHPPAFDPLPLLALVVLAFVPATCAAAGGSAASLAQTGGLRLAPLHVALGKLAPLPGLKRMFGMEAVVGATRAGIAFAAVLAIVAPLGLRSIAAVTTTASPASAAGVALSGMLQSCFAAAAVGGLFAFADFAVVRGRWLRSLKMTFEEFRRDAKEQDGDPHAKSRRKQLHRSLVQGGIARTREASFVVVNPTHIAVALRYAPPQVPVPEVLVRAADALALDVRTLAEREGIPVVENVELARLLWRIGAAGRPIPPESFVAVAYVIAALVRSGVLA